MADGGAGVATLLHIVLHAGHCRHPLGRVQLDRVKVKVAVLTVAAPGIAGFHLDLNTP